MCSLLPHLINSDQISSLSTTSLLPDLGLKMRQCYHEGKFCSFLLQCFSFCGSSSNGGGNDAGVYSDVGCGGRVYGDRRHSLTVERILHYLGKFLKHKGQNALFSALQKIKEGLISSICVPKMVSSRMLPCKVETNNPSNEGGHESCPKEGQVPLLSLEALHQLHIFIFVLAVVHVVFCATIMVLGGAKTTYGFESCIMESIQHLIPRLVIGVLIQVFFSYSTLPLYALVTQMGDLFKETIFEESIASTLREWAEGTRKKTKKRSQSSYLTVQRNSDLSFLLGS